VADPKTFAGARLDRAAERRSDERWLAERRVDPASRMVVTSGDAVHVSGDPPQLALVPADASPGPVLLGVSDGRALFAADADAVDPAALDGARSLSLREAGATMGADAAGVAAYAAALIGWQRRNRYCGICGTSTQVAEAGHVLACPGCGAQHHPRTDPVVIMVVEDGDRLLLGRQARWPASRYSALAGFVEPGESLEDAVRRELREEAGVEVADVTYHSSQPWPFPMNVMLGFTARHVSGDPAPLDRELEDVRWFDRGEVAAAAAGGGPVHVPPPLAIARTLIDHWLAQRPR